MTIPLLLAALDCSLAAFLTTILVVYLITLERRPRYIAAFFRGVCDVLTAVARVFAGKIGTIVVYKLDRLSRKLRDGINALCDWCEWGLRVVAVTQQIDFNGTVGKMLAAVLLGIAEMEQETRRERQAAGIAVAKKSGKYKGRKIGTSKAAPSRALELREKGLTAVEIATGLGVSRNTVFVYLRQSKSERDAVNVVR
jgi:DNA invertase Pin-like site-specific DNA recombinase